MEYSFKAELKKIGVNPFVFVPEDILQQIFINAGKSKGPIPIYGMIYDKSYRQTLVKFEGLWRLYINTSMLKNSPKRIGEILEITIAFDPVSRVIKIPALFESALAKNEKANHVFKNLPASRKTEIVRYLANLKSESTLQKNIDRAILFLEGKSRFVGRESP